MILNERYQATVWGQYDINWIMKFGKEIYDYIFDGIMQYGSFLMSLYFQQTVINKLGCDQISGKLLSGLNGNIKPAMEQVIVLGHFSGGVIVLMLLILG